MKNLNYEIIREHIFQGTYLVFLELERRNVETDIFCQKATGDQQGAFFLDC